jgi:hypothetical protein
MNRQEAFFEKWTIHQWPTSPKLPLAFYIGPVHGRTAVSSYRTKAEAEAALYMREWFAEKVAPKKEKKVTKK